MNGPLVSIVMPCYQNGRTLARTVRSIQAQTEQSWELIAVDDGSKDDTLAVLTQLAQDEPRMRVIHQEMGACPLRATRASRRRGERGCRSWTRTITCCRTRFLTCCR